MLTCVTALVIVVTSPSMVVRMVDNDTIVVGTMLTWVLVRVAVTELVIVSVIVVSLPLSVIVRSVV